MSLVLHNTLVRKKQKFIPLKKEKVSLYTCGPTVYNYVHVGNLRAYIFGDILKRVLLFNGFKVNHVMNITDVGHLTSDADEGEDKMLKGARRENKTVWEIAEFYTKAFLENVDDLHILRPSVLCKATDHIQEQIAMIKKLEKNGLTYQVAGNVYFNTSKFKNYGKLAGLKRNDHNKARVELDKNKKNVHDFVLWFTKSRFQDQEMKWDSPWGTGYPGWHIECSAMASKYLGEQFDIHCGGIDHIPVHHTNEIAQSEGAFEKKPWVNYWLHNEFLVLGKGEKMAKSGENFVTLQTLKERGFDPLDYRYFCLGTHYRNPLMFSYEALEGARISRKKMFDFVLSVKGSKSNSNGKDNTKKYLDKFTKGMNDDLNTPKALATVWEVIKSDLSKGNKYSLLLQFDKVLGFNFGNLKNKEIPSSIIKLAKDRDEARKRKDWVKSDQLRNEINSKGYIVEDTKEGFELKKI